MANLNILSVGLALGALISFGIISFALTVDVLREYFVNDVHENILCRQRQARNSTQLGDKSPRSPR